MTIQEMRANFERKNEHAKNVLTVYDKLEMIMYKKKETDIAFARQCRSIERNHNSNVGVYAQYLEKCRAIKAKTYTDLKMNRGVSITTIIAICIVLCLDMQTTKELLSVTPYNLSPLKREHRAYEVIIECRQYDNIRAEDAIEHYNKFLKLEGIKPLGPKL